MIPNASFTDADEWQIPTRFEVAHSLFTDFELLRDLRSGEEVCHLPLPVLLRAGEAIFTQRDPNFSGAWFVALRVFENPAVLADGEAAPTMPVVFALAHPPASARRTRADLQNSLKVRSGNASEMLHHLRYLALPCDFPTSCISYPS